MASITVEELVFSISTTGAAEATVQINRVSQAMDSVEESGEKADKGLSTVSGGLMSVFHKATAAIAIIGTLAAALGTLSGVKLAAQYQRLETGFEAMLGSAEKAHKLMSELKRMGEETPFKTVELVAFSRRLLATGSTAAEVVKQMKALSEFGAATGKTDSELGEVVSIMSRLRFRPHLDIREIGELGGLGVNLQQIVGAATGKNFKNQAQASQYLAGLSGAKAFDVLLSGMDKKFSSAAGFASTFLSVIENTGEAIGNIMLPTGKLLLPILGRVLLLVQHIAQFVGGINEMTAGFSGLASIVYILIRAKGLLVFAYKSTVGAVIQLTAALEAMAAAAEVATVATRTEAVADGTKAIAGTAATAAVAGGIAGSIGKGGTAATAVADAGMAAKLGKLKGGIAFFLGALLADWIIGKVADSIRGKGGRINSYIGDALQNMVNGAISGAGIGFAFGGPMGAAIGGSIGAALGILSTFYNYMWGDKSGKDDQAADTKRAADALEDIRGQMIGGGPRGRRVMGDLEVQMAIIRATMPGGAGVM